MRLPVLGDIDTMDRAALSAAWTDLFPEPVPKSLSQAFLRRFIAFEIQARRQGGLPRGFRSDLARAVHRRERSVAPSLAPGGRLLREWNGVALRSGTPLAAIAQRAKHPPHHIRSRMALAFLSPKIQRVLLDGTQPPELCLERLVRQVLPLDWSEQERLCGLA